MRIEVKLNSAGIREYLTSESVADELARRAKKLKNKAGTGYEMKVSRKGKRARARVVAKSATARRNESENANLRRAIGSL